MNQVRGEVGKPLHLPVGSAKLEDEASALDEPQLA
jgi:hypothetical protein